MSVQYLHIRPGSHSFPKLKELPFKAVVVIEDDEDIEWRKVFSRWLVDAGCLYMMAWGTECESWHDCVDHANLEGFDYGEIPDDRFVMTTWHTKDTMKETFWYSKHCAVHPNVKLQKTLLVHISNESNEHEILLSYENA